MNRQQQEENIIEQQDYKPKSLKDYLKTRKTKTTKADFRFQELGMEMQEYFKQNIWYLFYKYDEFQIKDAFTICKNKGIKKINYLVGIIRRLN